MSPYATALLDLDHTIFDFDASEYAAFAAAMRVVGIDEHGEHFEAYRRINLAMWTAVERGTIRSNDVRNRRFEMLADELRLDVDDLTVVAMADAFVEGLGAFGDLYPGAREVLDALASRVPVALVSNGLGEVVHARLARLGIEEHFATVVVSSEVGAGKPSPAIFDVAFERLGGPAKHTAVMIGDSLSSDIAGGTGYGIATCWYNPHARSSGPHDTFTHEIRDLHELTALIS